MKYQALFYMKIKKSFEKFVVCCIHDLCFKGLANAWQNQQYKLYLVDFLLYVPVNVSPVMSGQVFQNRTEQYLY